MLRIGDVADRVVLATHGNCDDKAVSKSVDLCDNKDVVVRLE